MRPSYYLLLLLLVVAGADCLLTVAITQRRTVFLSNQQGLMSAVKSFGLSDLAISTEARYTRHPAVSDPLAPFMDHPMALEHFPSGSFYTPVR